MDGELMITYICVCVCVCVSAREYEWTCPCDEIINYKSATWTEALAGKDYDLIFDQENYSEDEDEAEKFIRTQAEALDQEEVVRANFSDDEDPEECCVSRIANAKG